MRGRSFFAVVLSVALVGAVACAGFACTSFAVYLDRTLYGANFDYTPNATRFSIEEHETGAVFLGTFQMGATYVATTGLNEAGLFCTDQIVYPARAVVERPAHNEVYIWDAFEGPLGECATVDDVTNWIGGRRLVQYETSQLHNLYADTTGAAMVAECGTEGNAITEMDGPFIVMTNFHVGDFVQRPLDEIEGAGADRYRIAHAYIAEHLEEFDVDHAFEALRQASMSTESVWTRYSLVADPEALEIYLALERDYDHVWKISLTDRTIATYRGFDEAHVLPLGRTGVTGAQLEGYVPLETAIAEPAASPEDAKPDAEVSPSDGSLPILALLVAGLLGLGLCLFLLA